METFQPPSFLPSFPLSFLAMRMQTLLRSLSRLSLSLSSAVTLSYPSKPLSLPPSIHPSFSHSSILPPSTLTRPRSALSLSPLLATPLHSTPLRGHCCRLIEIPHPAAPGLPPSLSEAELTNAFEVVVVQRRRRRHKQHSPLRLCSRRLRFCVHPFNLLPADADGGGGEGGGSVRDRRTHLRSRSGVSFLPVPLLLLLRPCSCSSPAGD